jgi:hypothetical protein
MLPNKAIDRITEREKTRIKKIIDKKIVVIQAQIKEEKKAKYINWWWINGWQTVIKSLEEFKKEI